MESFASLLQAANYVETVESSQGTICALEEIAFLNGWIDNGELRKAADAYGTSSYGEHLRLVAGKQNRS